MFSNRPDKLSLYIYIYMCVCVENKKKIKKKIKRKKEEEERQENRNSPCMSRALTTRIRVYLRSFLQVSYLNINLLQKMADKELLFIEKPVEKELTLASN